MLVVLLEGYLSVLWSFNCQHYLEHLKKHSKIELVNDQLIKVCVHQSMLMSGGRLRDRKLTMHCLTGTAQCTCHWRPCQDAVYLFLQFCWKSRFLVE